MKTPYCIPYCISTQMVILFICQMITQSHLLPLNQQELDFMLDPVAQAQQDGLESKRVVAKSVFDVPLKTTAPSIIRCPPDSQRIIDGGPCVPTASSITTQYNLFQQLTREKVHFTNRRRPGPGQNKTKHRLRTTTVSPKVNNFGSGTSLATGSRLVPSVHSQDSAEKQSAQIFPSTAYVFHSPQENLPLPINQQMTSVNSHQTSQPLNTGEIIGLSTTELSIAEEPQDLRSTTITSSEISGGTMIESSLSDITDSLVIPLSTSFKSTDEVTDKSFDMDMEASSTVYVPHQYHTSTMKTSSRFVLKEMTTQPAANSANTTVNSDAAKATSRPDRPSFHSIPTTTGTENPTSTLLPVDMKDENANNTTEKVWFGEDIKSTIEPPVAADDFNNFSPGIQSNTDQSDSKIEFTTNRESSLLSWTSTSQPTSFATVGSLIETKEETHPITFPTFNENNFATTPINAQVTTTDSSTSETSRNHSGGTGKSVMMARKSFKEEPVTPTTENRESIFQPEIEVDFDVDPTLDTTTDRTQMPLIKENFRGQVRQSVPNPSSFRAVKPSETRSTFINGQIDNDNNSDFSWVRQSSVRNRDPIVTSSTDFLPQTRPRQKPINHNQFYVYDYITFNPDRPRIV